MGWDGTTFSTTARKYKKLYFSFDILLEGTDWEAGTVNTKLFYIGYGSGNNDTDAGIVIHEDGASPLNIRTDYPIDVWFSHGDAVDAGGNDFHPGVHINQNVAGQTTTRPLTVGVKHRIEWWLDLGTVDGNDGATKAWVDGVKVIDITGTDPAWGSLTNPDNAGPLRKSADDARMVPPGATTYGVFNSSFAPIFTSGLDKTRDDAMVIDNIYISGELDPYSPGPAQP